MTANDDNEALLEAGRLAALGELVRDCAHEIANPLFAVLALSELLLQDLEPRTKAHERLTLLRESADGMRKVVEAMQGFAREQATEPADVALQDVARSAVSLVRTVLAARDVEIAERYGEVPALVHGDAARLRLLLVSLVLNAVRSLPRGGTVSVEIAADGGEVVAAVEDDGAGFAPEEAEAAFDLFRTTRGGSGLGPTVARAIAERHRGTLAVEAAEGPGARVVLRLPEAAR
jgi:two-component system, NtrC family, sensor histidine kinase HydH